MKKLNLGRNWNGTETRFSVEDDVAYTEDVMPGAAVQSILDENHRRRSMGRQPNRDAHGRLVAQIPQPIYATWRKEWKDKYNQDWTWQTFLMMKLNSRDYSYLKTNEMKL